MQAEEIPDTGIDILSVDLKVWLGLLIAIISLITIYLRSRRNKSEDKLTDKLKEKLTQEQVETKDRYARRVLKTHLKALREDIEADRVWVAKFHNGSPDEVYPGSDVWQMISVVEDAVGEGVSSEKTNLQHIPVLFYKPYLDKVSEDGYFFVEGISNLSMPIYMLLKSQGVKSLGIVGLFNVNGYLKGIIGYDIITQQEQLDPTDIEKIEDVGKVIIDYLNDISVRDGKFGPDRETDILNT